MPYDTARRLLDNPRRPQVRTAIAGAVAAGWQAAALAREIGGNWNGVTDPAAVLIHRLDQLGDPPPRPDPAASAAARDADEARKAAQTAPPDSGEAWLEAMRPHIAPPPRHPPPPHRRR